MVQRQRHCGTRHRRSRHSTLLANFDKTGTSHKTPNHNDRQIQQIHTNNQGSKPVEPCSSSGSEIEIRPGRSLISYEPCTVATSWFGLEVCQLLRLFAPICHSSKVNPTKKGVMLNGPGSLNILKTKDYENNIKSVTTGEAVYRPTSGFRTQIATLPQRNSIPLRYVRTTITTGKYRGLPLGLRLKRKLIKRNGAP
jgi:hypothetical protein